MTSGRQKTQKVVAFPSATARRLFVLDTSVLLHDPDALTRFKEHDVLIPRQVVAQLDRRKKDQTYVGSNARQVARALNELFNNDRALMKQGVPLVEYSSGSATGNLFVQMESLTFPMPKDILDDDADRRIIGVACALRRERHEYGKVVLVSKDTIMRLAALGVPKSDIEVADYHSDRVLLKDSDVLPSGFHLLSPEDWDAHELFETGQEGARSRWRIRGPLVRQAELNECVFLPDGTCAKVRHREGDVIDLETATNYAKHPVSGVTARNREQNIALGHLMDPNIDLTVLLGDAGTGKTLLSVASAFAHLGRDDVAQIIVTRAMVPVGGESERLGFLPGDADDKFEPWMMAIQDATEALLHNAGSHENKRDERQITRLRERIKFQPIGLIAGRTFARSVIIVDEAQNLTPHLARMLVTRAGEDTKMIFCGNLSQIDSPYLDERSSGLTFLVMRLRGQPHVAHVILERCVRSRLAKTAVDLL